MSEELGNLEQTEYLGRVGGRSDILGVSVGRAVFSIAWPAILASLLENMATTIDLIMVGRLGAAQVASVGLCGMIFWILSALAVGLSISAMAVVARSLGGSRRKEASLVLGQTLTLAFTASAAVSAITILCSPLIFRLFEVSEEVGVISVDYLRILSVGMVFFSVMSVASGALRGAGDTRTPMFVGLVINLIHIVLNYLLIFGKMGFPALGARGAAIGTSISYCFGSAVYLALFLRGPVVIRLGRGDFGLDKRRVSQVVRLGLPAAVEQFVVQFGLLVYVKFIVEFGTAALSGYQVGMRILALSFIPNFGFSTAAAALIGQNLGAGKKEEAKQAGWVCLKWAIISMSAMGILFLVFSHQLAAIFVDDAEVIELGALFIRIVGYLQAGMAIHFTLAGALRGAGDTRWPLFTTLLGMYVCRIPATWVLTHFFGMGLLATWNLLFLDYLVRVVLIITRYRRGKWLETCI
jgi:putative MATE family efflux protein